MIILCHFLQYYGNEAAWWFNVGVQIFFVLSGFLYGSKDISSPLPFYKKQFEKILVPYYLFLIPVILLYGIFAPAHLSLYSIVSSLFCAGTVDGIEHLWFVGYILFCYLITPLLYELKKYTEKYSAARKAVYSLALLLLILITGILFNSHFAPDRISCFVVGYIIAVALEQYGSKAFDFIFMVFSALAILMNGLRIAVKYVFSLNLNRVLATLFDLFEDYAHLALGVALFLAMYKLFKNFKGCPLLHISDNISYCVYIVHQLFILSPFHLMALTGLPVLNCCIALLCIIICAVILRFSSEKVMHFINIKE